MSGLNYGYKYCRLHQFSEGVSWADKIGKWIVRVKRYGKGHNGHTQFLTTIGSYDKKEDADECYRRAVATD